MEHTWARDRFTRARVARLGTVSPDEQPHLVPVVFAATAETIWTVVDAKPKSRGPLRRLTNISVNPRVSLLVDDYTEDWSALWWVRADGSARVVPVESADGAAGLAALRAKYQQYQAQPPPGPMIVISADRWSSWSAG